MYKIILASQSPRRKQLMEAAELDFEIVIADVDETNPEGMPGEQVPEHLARKKAAAIEANYPEALIIAADTVVLLDQEILGKPKDEEGAIHMLGQLQGRMHKVVTGVSMQKGDQQIGFSVTTQVYFRPLTTQQITHYVKQYKPYDKAGSYAIQEWIGMIGIEKIDGDYYNVMGLPIGDVVRRLNEFR
ncbi:MAG: septum formation protein Maf [Sphingobacteriales bacterium]|nr:MAG: septum formation protein Maf [Sphingobacteriales bacterium]